MNEPNKEYLDLVKSKMPKSQHLKTMFRAFWVGGFICCIGQAFNDIYTKFLGDKMPEDEMREMISQFNIVPGQVHVVTSSSLMHAGGWCFRTRDVQTLRSPGEMKYAARRAVAEKRRPLVLDNAGFNALLKSRDRKDVVYIYRTKKKPEKTRGITHANEYHGKELSARYYPVAGKVSGEK